MKMPHKCNLMKYMQLSNFGVFGGFDLAIIVQWS